VASGLLLSLLTLGLVFVLYQRKTRATILRPKGGGTTSAPTMENSNNVALDPWTVFKDMDSTGREDDDFEEEVHFDEFDASSYSGSSAEHSSMDSSMSMEEQPDGRVTLMKTSATRIPSSAMSTTSDHLHVFTDANDDQSEGNFRMA
jgi:hypothetical protein